MAIIQRPGKEGNATTYQGKVAAGYTKILAQEVDADIDAIYTAWNSGVDTVNIKPGAVGPAQLAPGAVGSSALGPSSVQTANLAPGAVTTPILAAGAVTPSTMANGGAMGGDLSGTFPNPALSVIQSGAVQLGNGGRVVAIPQVIALTMNDAGAAGTDPTKANWAIWLEGSADCLQVFRTQPGGSQVQMLLLDSGGYLHALLPNGAIGRAQLGINAIYGAAVSGQTPPGFILNTPSVWMTVTTLPSLTTRGGNVQLHANHCLSVNGPPNGAICYQRWLRDGSSIAQWSFNIAQASTMFAPFAGINMIDTTCPAGAHVYSYQVFVAASCTILGSTATDGLFQAVEIG